MDVRQKAVFSALVSAVLLAACSGNDIDIVSSVPATATATGDVDSAAVQAVATSPTNPDAAAAAVIPQGTKLINASGQTIDGSNVTVTLVAFDGSVASQDEVTGGNEFTDQPVASALANALGQSLDTSKPVVITIAGFARVNVSASGQSIKQFDPAITIRIKTGLPQGQTVGVLSIDEATGERRFEGTATVGSAGNVTIQTDHLTDIVVASAVTGSASGSGGSTQ